MEKGGESARCHVPCQRVCACGNGSGCSRLQIGGSSQPERGAAGSTRGVHGGGTRLGPSAAGSSSVRHTLEHLTPPPWPDFPRDSRRELLHDLTALRWPAESARSARLPRRPAPSGPGQQWSQRHPVRSGSCTERGSASGVCVPNGRAFAAIPWLLSLARVIQRSGERLCRPLAAFKSKCKGPVLDT